MSSTTDRRIRAIQRAISEKPDYTPDLNEETFEPFISELVSHTPPGFQHTFTYDNPAGYREHFANTTTKTWLISISIILVLAILIYYLIRRMITPRYTSNNLPFFKQFHVNLTNPGK